MAFSALTLTVSCFSKIQIGFTFLVLAHLGSPGKRAVKRVWYGRGGLVASGAEGPGFKSQLRHCRVTVLGKLFTPTVPLFTKQQNW